MDRESVRGARCAVGISHRLAGKSVLMSVLDRLLPRCRWWRMRQHAVCVPCHRRGREWCEVVSLLRACGLLELWWWVTDAVIVDADVETRARTARTRKTVPQPSAWADNAALYDRLYDEANCKSSIK